MSESFTPTLDDFLEEGRAMEAANQRAAEVHEQDNQDTRAALHECRDLAMGILAIAHSSMGDLLENVPFEPQMAYCLACTGRFCPRGYHLQVPHSSSPVYEGCRCAEAGCRIPCAVS